MEEGEPTDVVRASELFAEYAREHLDMQKDKQTKKDLDTIVKALQARFPDSEVHQAYTQTWNPYNRQKRSYPYLRRH